MKLTRDGLLNVPAKLEVKDGVVKSFIKRRLIAKFYDKHKYKKRVWVWAVQKGFDYFDSDTIYKIHYYQIDKFEVWFKILSDDMGGEGEDTLLELDKKLKDKYSIKLINCENGYDRSMVAIANKINSIRANSKKELLKRIKKMKLSIEVIK